MPSDEPLQQTAAEPATSPRRRAALIHRIRTLMEFWGITAHELRHHQAVPTRPPLETPKYRHPTTGDTWNGQGPQPDWLRRALLKEGYTVEQLRQATAAATGFPAQAGADAPPP